MILSFSCESIFKQKQKSLKTIFSIFYLLKKAFGRAKDGAKNLNKKCPIVSLNYDCYKSILHILNTFLQNMLFTLSLKIFLTLNRQLYDKGNESLSQTMIF